MGEIDTAFFKSGNFSLLWVTYSMVIWVNLQICQGLLSGNDWKLATKLLIMLSSSLLLCSPPHPLCLLLSFLLLFTIWLEFLRCGPRLAELFSACAPPNNKPKPKARETYCILIFKILYIFWNFKVWCVEHRSEKPLKKLSKWIVMCLLLHRTQFLQSYNK